MHQPNCIHHGTNIECHRIAPGPPTHGRCVAQPAQPHLPASDPSVVINETRPSNIAVLELLSKQMANVLEHMIWRLERGSQEQAHEQSKKHHQP